jgi:hypothetical protein
MGLKILLLAATVMGIAQSAYAQTALTIFGAGVPKTAVDPDTSAVNLGVKFFSKVPGTVSAIRFYRGHSNGNGYTVRLYTANGAQLTSKRVTTDTCKVPCWEQVNLAAPISIAANTTYVAAYYTSNGRYADDSYGLTNGAGTAPLLAQASVPGSSVGGNGVYNYSTGFPTQTWQDSNYWVDVMFTPNNPTLSLSFNPPSPSLDDSSPVGTPITQAVASWSNGAPFTGTYGLVDNDGGICVINPSTGQVTVGSALPSSDVTQNCTVSATQ